MSRALLSDPLSKRSRGHLNLVVEPEYVVSLNVLETLQVKVMLWFTDVVFDRMLKKILWHSIQYIYTSPNHNSSRLKAFYILRETPYDKLE